MIFLGIRKKLIFCFITVVVIAAGILFYFRYIKAASFSLYPGSCLGSWQNPHLAQGWLESNDILTINRENSAVFSEGGIKEIYCGSFNGDLSENEIKLIKSVNLKFSWLISDEELKTATSSIIIIQPLATSSEVVAQNTNEVISQILNNIRADEVSVIVSTTTTPEITVTANPTETSGMQQEANNTENTAAIIIDSAKTESETAPSVDSTSSPQATSSPTAFWWKKYNFFYADDEVSNTQISNAGQIATSSLDNPIAPTENFLSVSYTLDGVNWQELGTVNKDNWQNLSFKIPVNQLEDIKKIQIKIESLPLLNKTPYVYLDGLMLEVNYDSENLTAAMPVFPMPIESFSFVTASSYRRNPSSTEIKGPAVISISNLDKWKGVSCGNFWHIIIEADVKGDMNYSSPVYPTTVTSAEYSFNLPYGNYYDVSVEFSPDDAVTKEGVFENSCNSVPVEMKEGSQIGFSVIGL